MTLLASRRSIALLSIAAGLAGTCVPVRAWADDACAAFKWNVAHERALFATQPLKESAGRDAASATRIRRDRLYRVRLIPEEKVSFAATPGKRTPTEGTYAGVVLLHLAAAGTYRVSLSQRFWVDVVKDGKIISSEAFTGAHGCNAPRKVVQYRLPAGNVLLQISGEASPEVELAVTRP
ncbi:MAG TPA: hypothetical protein VMU52_05710 [Steroidobacteraceae bacterium]|nr:hypothetical protein [Steroidobacteraceae bacterium]